MTAKPKKPAAKKATARKVSPWKAWTNAAEKSIAKLCERIEDGESLRQVADGLGVPTSTLTRWIEADPQRSARAREARRQSARSFDDAALEEIRGAADQFELARAKEVAHHLRWRASKINPREYGDKLDVTQELTIKDLPVEHLQEGVKRLLAKAGIKALGDGAGGSSAG